MPPPPPPRLRVTETGALTSDRGGRPPPRRVLAARPHDYVVTRVGGPDVVVTGALLLAVAPPARDRYPPRRFYLLGTGGGRHGRFVAVRYDPGREGPTEAVALADEAAVYRFFGHDALAKHLYRRAGLRPPVDEL